MRDIFDLLFRIQQRRNLRLLIIGGWALQAHHYSRFTNDVDCMVALDDDEAMGEELARSGFECFTELPAFRRFRHRLDPTKVLDVMRVDVATFAKLFPESKEHPFMGLTLRAPSLLHLIALKLHASRQEHRAGKDLPDIIAMLEANPGVVSPAALREILDRYGTPELAAQLARWL